MIVTFTPNPSIDATLEVDSLNKGGVLRARSSARQPGGKGINVAHACVQAGRETLAIVPCGPGDPFALLARDATIPMKTVEIEGRIRTNTTLTEADGTTTKINELGPILTEVEVERILDALITTVAETRADAVVLAGSLPPGAPQSWYSSLCGAVRRACPSALVAVDTSEEYLKQLGMSLEKALVEVAPNVIKPNAFELAQLTDTDGSEFEKQSLLGNYQGVVAAARQVISLGVREVLVTLGASGACLITEFGAWAANPPPATIRSTVGAGDCSLAGYVMSRVSGGSFSECLRYAVAYGTAAASQPGTGIPSPDELDLERTHVIELEIYEH